MKKNDAIVLFETKYNSYHKRICFNLLSWVQFDGRLILCIVCLMLKIYPIFFFLLIWSFLSICMVYKNSKCLITKIYLENDKITVRYATNNIINQHTDKVLNYKVEIIGGNGVFIISPYRLELTTNSMMIKQYVDNYWNWNIERMKEVAQKIENAKKTYVKEQKDKV